MSSEIYYFMLRGRSQSRSWYLHGT